MSSMEGKVRTRTFHFPFSIIVALVTVGWLGSFVAKSALAQEKLTGQSGMYRSDTFGAGWTLDSLANVEIGRFVGRVVDYRFRADHSGTFSAIQLYFIFRTNCDNCYSDGDGGIIQIQVCSDDGSPLHLPSMTVLGSTIVTNPFLQWNRTVSFQQPVAVTANALYHIVFANLSNDPVHNYVSIDDGFANVSGTNLQPAVNETNLAVLLKNGNDPLQVLHQHVPIFSIYFDDGFRQGQGYIDVKHNGMQLQSGSRVTETFLVQDASHTVSRLAVRFDPLTTVGDVKVTLNNALGQPLTTGVLNFTQLAQYSYGWQSVTFSPLILAKGSSYSITLAAENGAQFYVSPIEQGALYGFQTENLFAGECVVPLGVGWTGCMGLTYLDIPFYFR